MTDVEIERLAAGSLDASIDDGARLFVDYLGFYERDASLDDARRYLTDRVRASDSLVYLARVDGEAVGFAQVYPTWSSLDLARSWTLEDLFVAPTARRTGVARALLDQLAADARTAGACRIVLETAHINTQAQALYESYGFQQDQEFRIYTLFL
jgi:ribosomal protein S18 acetylase RimI-like enzyme